MKRLPAGELKAVGAASFGRNGELGSDVAGESEIRFDSGAVAEAYLARIADFINLDADQEEQLRSAIRPTMSPPEALDAIHDRCLTMIGLYREDRSAEVSDAVLREQDLAAKLAYESIRETWERQGDLNVPRPELS